MPFVYVVAKAEIIIDLPERGFMSNWESKQAKKICTDYGHPLCSINCKINNPEEPISPVLIYIYDRDAIDGGITVKRVNEVKYIFTISGKFKSEIHKIGLALLNEGHRPLLDGVGRYRETFPFETPKEIDWIFSTKKI